MIESYDWLDESSRDLLVSSTVSSRNPSYLCSRNRHPIKSLVAWLQYSRVSGLTHPCASARGAMLVVLCWHAGSWTLSPDRTATKMVPNVLNLRTRCETRLFPESQYYGTILVRGLPIHEANLFAQILRNGSMVKPG